MTTISRRECLLTLGSAAIGAQLSQTALAAPDSHKAMRGVFIILNTPFMPSGEIDWDDLVREVDFVERGGCSGIVWPHEKTRIFVCSSSAFSSSGRPMPIVFA